MNLAALTVTRKLLNVARGTVPHLSPPCRLLTFSQPSLPVPPAWRVLFHRYVSCALLLLLLPRFLAGLTQISLPLQSFSYSLGLQPQGLSKCTVEVSPGQQPSDGMPRPRPLPRPPMLSSAGFHSPKGLGREVLVPCGLLAGGHPQFLSAWASPTSQLPSSRQAGEVVGRQKSVFCLFFYSISNFF